MILVVDPTDCLACGFKIGVWQLWEHAAPRRRLAVVLTRLPNDNEQRALRFARIDPAGILDTPHRGLDTPRVYRYQGSALVDSAVGPAALDRLSLSFVGSNH